MKLTSTLGREDVELREIEGLIVRDPVITARVIQAANSAAFAGYGATSSVHNALLRLGIERVRLIDVEGAVLGIDHATIGARLAKQWLFPPSVCAAIRGHHRIGTVEPEHRWNTLVVHLAESLASQSNINGLGEGVILVPDDPGLAELGISPDVLPAMVLEAQTEVERAGSMLDAA